MPRSEGPLAVELHVELDRPHDRIVFRFAGSLGHRDDDIDGLLEAFRALDFSEIVLDCARLTDCGTAGRRVIGQLRERIIQAHRTPRITGLARQPAGSERTDIVCIAPLRVVANRATGGDRGR